MTFLDEALAHLNRLPQRDRPDMRRLLQRLEAVRSSRCADPLACRNCPVACPPGAADRPRNSAA